ncbi:MAG: MBL fold metallo-hydrolase [Candidatus Bathyarchaeota archaeon]
MKIIDDRFIILVCACDGVGYLIKAEDKIIYHAGDTDLIPEMKRLESVDVALLPTGDKYTMDNNKAAEAAC